MDVLCELVDRDAQEQHPEAVGDEAEEEQRVRRVVRAFAWRVV